MANVKPELRALAKEFFFAGKQQQEIATLVGVSENTVSKWSRAEGWQEQRAAKNITRTELVNKLLASVNKLIDDFNSKEDGDSGRLCDQLCKFSASIAKLDKKASIVDIIETFIAFGKWLEYRAKTDKDLTPELIKTINHYQDIFITEQVGKE